MALVTKNFSDIITFTRASTGTFFNSAGVLTSAAINAPRFDYNPATLAAQGLLIEEARTNYALYSQVFTNAAYLNAPDDVTVTDNAVISPDGTTNAATYVEGTASATHARFQRVSGLTANSPYTISLLVKYNGGGRGFVLAFGSSTGTAALNSANRGFARWNTLAAGAATATGGSGTGSVTSTNAINIGNGWFRLTMTFVFDTGNTSTSFAFGFGISNASVAIATTGDGSSYSIYGLQLEVGAFPTSYIPTTTTALTRSADVASVNTLSPWWNASEGTFYVEGSAGSLANSPIFVMPHDGTSNNYLNSPLLTTAGLARLAGAVGGAAWTNVNTANSTTANTTFKSASAFKAGDQAICLNAGTVVTGVNASVPVVTTVKLGDWRTSGNNINGYLRRITYYPRRLSNVELQVLTAPINSTTSIQPYSLDTNFIGNTVSIGA